MNFDILYIPRVIKPMAHRAVSSPQRALPAHVTPSPLLETKRCHTRSSSLENANSFLSKNTLGLPIMLPGQTGTLKSRNEQKRIRNKFGSHNNLDDYVGHIPLQQQLQQQQQQQQQKQGRLRFQNIRQFFEISKSGNTTPANSQKDTLVMPAIPTAMTQSETAATLITSAYNNNQRNEQQQQQKTLNLYQQQHQRRPTPTKHATGSGNRNSIASDITISNSEQHKQINVNQLKQHKQQQLLQQQQQQMQQSHPLTQQQKQRQEQINGIGSTHNLRNTVETPEQAANNILRPIAFKPIPFEPDYSIPSRYCDGGAATTGISDRFGSTPSLAPVQGSNLRFGSTTDLRNTNNINTHNNANNNSNNNNISNLRGFIAAGSSCNIGVGISGGVGGGTFAGYSSNNYCNSLMARRRGSRSLKINDSMESIRHTPDLDAQSQSSTIKSNCTAMNNHSNIQSNCNNIINSNGNINSKYLLSEQCDMTPSPSDSGISDLEAALKDRDSELSYLRQTMEHNEKDKEVFWEKETKRLKAFYDEQQREYLLKIKKMEQMLAMQQFQFKQHKLKHSEQSNNLREQLSDLKNENEILRSNNTSLKNSERNLKDRVAYIEEQLNGTIETVNNVKAQLEDCEWKVCERNGEIALLKTQLKEANVEITLKEHAIVHLKNEHTNNEAQIYQSYQENHKLNVQENVEMKKATDSELKQLNKIIILKDQVILALTNELAKLRKELSDLAISHEYGEEPSGKYTRLKQQLDSLTDICNKKRFQKSTNSTPTIKTKVIDDSNLEVIMNCLKIAPALNSDEGSDGERNLKSVGAEKRLAKISTDIQNFVYGTQNLPDVAVSIHNGKMPMIKTTDKLEESTLDTLIEESANYAEEIGKLRRQLDDVRINFELEKRQWCEEREKVLRYQKQLQTHYINMYQKLRSLENSVEGEF